MKYSYVLNLLLALALVILSVKIVFMSDSKIEKQADVSIESKEQIVIDNIMTRTSIRAYQEKPVEETKIEIMLRAGMAAPTAGNKQPWAFVVIKDRAILDSIPLQLPPAKPVAASAVSIVVCGDLEKTFEGEGVDYWIQDVSAASENILLAAHSLGLGAVWCGIYPISARVAYIKEILNLPENIIPLGVIAIGYPAENPMPKDKWNPNLIHQNRW